MTGEEEQALPWPLVPARQRRGGGLPGRLPREVDFSFHAVQVLGRRNRRDLDLASKMPVLDTRGCALVRRVLQRQGQQLQLMDGRAGR